MFRSSQYLLVLFSIYCQWTFADRPVPDNQSRTLSNYTLSYDERRFPVEIVGQWIKDKSIVLLGDGTHGTREFYQYRRELTQYLISEQGFSAVIVEGNWPGGQSVNAYIHGQTQDSVIDSMEGFKAYFPWVWRNQTILDLIPWLRDYNLKHPTRPLGFYGMDIFSLYPSINRVLAKQSLISANDANIISGLLQCFSPYQEIANAYGEQVAENPSLSCQKQAESQFIILEKLYRQHPYNTQYFDLFINSRVIVAAEQYFRLLHQAERAHLVWNNREQTMKSIVDEIIQFGHRKVIIWAHNSHVGDARATSATEIGDISIGQLLRQAYGEASVFLMGAISHQGEVFAAGEWGEPGSIKTMPPAIKGSYSALFHQLGLPRFILNLRRLSEHILFDRFYERFIGVVYHNDEEERYHYQNAVIHQQFDALLYIDKSRPVEPLD